MVRILPPEEWNRLVEVGPFAVAGVLPDPLYATVIVEENESGEIVGTWMVTSIMLLEGLWRREDQRKGPIGARNLLFGMLGYLTHQEIKSAITVIEDPQVAELAEKVGFVPLAEKGRIHVLTLKEQ